MVASTIQHLLADRASGTLIVPLDEVAAWWPLLYPQGPGHPPAGFVTGRRDLGPPSHVFITLPDHCYSRIRSTHVIALRIDGRII
jgi:hypothetical protein